MSQNAPQPLNAETGSTTCQNCHSSMPLGLRFCRNCGYRLGEGVAEYTETVRFNSRPTGSATTVMPGNFPSVVGKGEIAPIARGAIKCRKRRMSGLTWIFLIMIMFFVIGAGVSFFVPKFPGRIGGTPGATQPRSYFGVNSFDTTDGGVTFDSIEAPGSPADKAGLVGGDVITAFDGQQVTSEDQIMELLGKTPIGKTVDVVYIRDGDTKTTKLTTISKGELDQLGRVFATRPGGRGRLGIDDQETVELPGTKLHGARLGTVQASLPGDMAGLKSGDVVIDFGGTPIRTAEELNYRIQAAVPYETVVIKVMRGSEVLEIPVRMGRR